MIFTINQCSAAAAILVFIFLSCYKYYFGLEIVLSEIIIASIAGGMLPLAVAFTLYPFFPKLVKIEDMSLQITLTGLVLLFVYIKTIILQIP